jgi:DNA gyrase subunit B
MVKDYASGIPVEFNESEQRYNWELIFCELYAGGKFYNNEEEIYSYSLGLNGLGLCATQYSSEYMDVVIVRDGYRYELHFEKGENVGGLTKTKTDESVTGTTIVWRPDLDVFTDINIPTEYFHSIIKRQAVVNEGITFIFNDDENGEVQTYLYENGIKDYIEEIALDKNVTAPYYMSHETRGRDRDDMPEYKLKFEVIFALNNEINLLDYYHNSSYLEYGGSPDKAVKSAFVSALDSYIKNANQYKKDEKKLTFTDIQDSLLLISNSFSTITSYENQTKKAINNKFIQEAMTDFLKRQLEVYFIENKADADKIAAQVLVNKRSRESAEKTRLSLKKKLTGTIDISNRVDKFVNCRTRDLSKRELYIVEGDSALGSCKLGREAEYQAIIAVRGKILNCLKADYDKIFNNEIITDLIRVLGCGVEIKTKNRELNSFELDKLQWSKVIICTDADYDGYHIRTMILTMLYRLTPTLINERRVYIAESPLYEINTSKKTYFAYTEKEKSQILAKTGAKVTIQRSKGLGENEPEMMWETTMNPETRRLVLVTPDEYQKTVETFDMLLGENIKARKEFIEEYGGAYLDMVDVV